MRKHLIWSCILALLAFPVINAQVTAGETKAEAKKTKQSESLTTTSDDSDDDEETPSVEEQFAQMKRDLGRAIRKFSRALRKSESADRAAIIKERDAAYNEIIAEAFPLIADAENDEQRISILTWIAARSTGASSKKALGHLLTDFSDSPNLKDLARSFTAASVQNENALRRIIAECSNIDVRGHATFSLYTNLKQLKRFAAVPDEFKAKLGESLGENGYEYLLKRSAKDLDEACVALLEQCMTEFKDVKDTRSTLGVVADNMLFAMKHLKIGKEVPEISGHDLDEVSFKLSDYRGKVVILDFWGDW